MPGPDSGYIEDSVYTRVPGWFAIAVGLASIAVAADVHRHQAGLVGGSLAPLVELCRVFPGGPVSTSRRAAAARRVDTGPSHLSCASYDF